MTEVWPSDVKHRLGDAFVDQNGDKRTVHVSRSVSSPLSYMSFLASLEVVESQEERILV